MTAPDINPHDRIVPGAGGLPKLVLSARDGAQAEIYLHGAQTTSWIPASGGERLYLSQKSEFRSGAAIRGGIPLIFPQFAALGSLPFHGLAQVMEWEFVDAQVAGDQTAAFFRLQDDEQSRSLWPHSFLAELTATIGGPRLAVKLAVTNTGSEMFQFTAALHTYLSVAEIGLTTVNGLAGLNYRDVAASRVEKHQGTPQAEFSGEVDRIYFAAPSETQVVEQGRTTLIRKTGFTDTVVWNPGAEKCALVPDMLADDYRRFLCVEAATVRTPVCLSPSERWQGSQELFA